MSQQLSQYYNYYNCRLKNTTM